MKLKVIAEGMGAAEYRPPTEPSELMADFYTLGLLQSGPRYAPSNRRDQLDYEIQHVESVLLPYLRQHMIQKAGYSILCELRHVYDMVGTNEQLFTLIGEPYRGNRADDKQIMKAIVALGVPRQIADYFRTNHGDRPSQEIMERLQEVDVANIARAGLQIFPHDSDLFRWPEMFGGDLWTACCKFLLKLIGSQSAGDISIYVDKIYQLQHNTGQLLNKNPEYDGRWLNEMLDLKFRASNPKEIIPYCSSHVRQLALMVMREKYGESWLPRELYPQELDWNRANTNTKSDKFKLTPLRTAKSLTDGLRELGMDTVPTDGIPGFYVVRGGTDAGDQVVRVTVSPQQVTVQYRASMGTHDTVEYMSATKVPVRVEDDWLKDAIGTIARLAENSYSVREQRQASHY